MKKINRKSLLRTCVLFFGAVFIYSSAWADFYVVAAGKKARRTVLVSPEGTAAASGTALLNALNGITDASASNPYLIIIEPGVYDIGINTLEMKEYVDIQGSGEKVTKITGNTGEMSGVLEGADNSELRFLTVENSGGIYAIAIANSGVSPAITHVTAIASGGMFNNYGVYNTGSASPTITHVTVTVSGDEACYAFYNYSSSPVMNHVTATASGTADNHGVYNLDGSSGTMNDMIITASGGNQDFGVYNSDSSPTMTNVTVTASDGATNTAIKNIDYSFPILSHVEATASGGTNCYGINNFTFSFPTVIHSTVTASGGGSNYGIWNATNSSIKIDHSVISGTSNTIFIVSGCSGFIGNTRLDGGTMICNGTCACAGVYDEDYTFYASTCP